MNFDEDDDDNEYKVRRWAFTWFPGTSKYTKLNYKYFGQDRTNEGEDIKQFFDEYCKLWVFGYEKCPKTGTYHLQGYMEFKNKVSKTWLNKMLTECRCRPAIASKQKNIEYCTKDGDYKASENCFEKSKQGKRNDIHRTRELLQQGASMRDILESTNSYQACRYAELYRKYFPNGRTEYSMPKLYWYYGESGTGKSRKAFNKSKKHDYWILSKDGNWFDGYDGQSHVIIDDFRPDMFTLHWLLRVTDGYPLQVPIKGGFTSWKPTHIFITTCHDPRKTYKNVTDENIDQLIRRIYKMRYFV